MNVLFIILFLVWSVRLLSNILSYINLWFVKEYRFDRMRIHLGTSEGKRILFIRFKRPPVSPKTITLMVVSSVGLSYLFFLLPLPLLFRLLIIDLFTFPIIAVFVGIFKIPTFFYHEILIVLAVRKLRNHVPMKVIGITGSFGKTSTKQFLTTILSTKFNVLSTVGSKNSPIAIAETILRELSPEHEVFVVEMGAYKRGEIARMARMVEPQMGIITAINTQHQDLFGSLEITAKAKYELIEGLTGKKIAIFNRDNTYTNEMISWAMRDGKEVWEYSINSLRQRTHETVKHLFSASNIESDLHEISFWVSLGVEKKRATVPIVGEHQISNILASIAGALACEMTFSDAIAAVSQIKPFPKVMDVQKGMHGSIFINDTYNNNPDAARAALIVLSKTSGKKYLVFQPMVELGSYAGISHEEIGKFASKVCNEIFLTNANYYNSFQNGIHAVHPSQNAQVLPSQEVANLLKKKLKQNDAVLFKGKEAEAVYQRLVNK